MTCFPDEVNWNNKEFTKEMLDYLRAVYCVHPMVLDALDYINSLESRIAELEADNAELKERVAMLDVTAVFKSLGEMGHIEQVDRLTARIAELEAENAMLKQLPQPIKFWSDEKKQIYKINERRTVKSGSEGCGDGT